MERLKGLKDIFEKARCEEESRLGGRMRLSPAERGYIAGHALDSLKQFGSMLGNMPSTNPDSRVFSETARKIAALSNLLGDIGWYRDSSQVTDGHHKQLEKWVLGELFPVAQLRPWLEKWQRLDDEALVEAEKVLEVLELEFDAACERGEGDLWRFPKPYEEVANARQAIAEAQTKLGTGAILLARLEKWMASRDN